MNNKELEATRESKKREIDTWFEEIEKNPFLGMPDGFDREKFLTDCAVMERTRIRRELTVIESQINTHFMLLSDIQRHIMYDPLYAEMGTMIVKNMINSIELLEDTKRQMKEDLLVLGYDYDDSDKDIWGSENWEGAF